MALTAARLAVQQLANAREAKAIRAAKKKLARETTEAQESATETAPGQDIDKLVADQVAKQVAIQMAKIMAQKDKRAKSPTARAKSPAKRAKSPFALDSRWKRVAPHTEHRGYSLFERDEPTSVLLYNQDPKAKKTSAQCRYGVNVGGKRPDMRGVLDEDIDEASTEAATPPPSNKKQTRLPFAAKSDTGPAAPAGTKRKLDPALNSESKSKIDRTAKKSKDVKKVVIKSDPATTSKGQLTAAEKVRAAMARF